MWPKNDADVFLDIACNLPGVNILIQFFCFLFCFCAGDVYENVTLDERKMVGDVYENSTNIKDKTNNTSRKKVQLLCLSWSKSFITLLIILMKRSKFTKNFSKVYLYSWLFFVTWLINPPSVIYIRSSININWLCNSYMPGIVFYKVKIY